MIGDYLLILEEIGGRNLSNRMFQLSDRFRKKFGEVFTPVFLVEEMLSKLPEEDWKNKHLKWLDPACGTGNFLLIIKEKLMEKLKDTISDTKEREKWILENMIYGVDLQERNTELCVLKLDPSSKYNLHVESHDSLKFNFWKLKFERIVGNPPYQKGQKGEGKRGGGNSLWDKFVKMAIDISKKGGYICFVHPSKWRKPGHKMWEEMTSKNIIYLELHDVEDGDILFGVRTRYDWYIMQNSHYDKDTVIKDETGKTHNINLVDLPFLPNCRFDEVFDLLAKNNEATCPIISLTDAYEIRKYWVSEKRTSKFKYPLIYATNKNEIRYYYSSRTDRGHFDIPKVIFGESGINGNSIIDMRGRYGMAHTSIAIKVKTRKEAKNIKKALDSEEFSSLLKTACSWGIFRIDWRLFTYFRRDWWKEFV